MIRYTAFFSDKDSALKGLADFYVDKMPIKSGDIHHHNVFIILLGDGKYELRIFSEF